MNPPTKQNKSECCELCRPNTLEKKAGLDTCRISTCACHWETIPNLPPQESQEKCKKHGVVHKNGGYPSCQKVSKECWAAEDIKSREKCSPKEDWEVQLEKYWLPLLKDKQELQILKSFISHVRTTAQKEVVEKIEEEVKKKQGWYNGAGNQPIRNVLDEILTLLSKYKEE
jgi:hypothetical protein